MFTTIVLFSTPLEDVPFVFRMSLIGLCLISCWLWSFLVIKNIQADKVYEKLLAATPAILILACLPLFIIPREEAYMCYMTALHTWLSIQRLIGLCINHGPLTDASANTFGGFAMTMTLPIRFISVEETPAVPDESIKSKHHKESEKLAAAPENMHSPPTTTDTQVATAGEQLRRGIICLILWTLSNIVLMSKFAQDNKQVFSFFLYPVSLLLGATYAFDLMGAFVQLVSGKALATSFDAPYMSDSLGDFWGRRWNLIVQEMMRRVVYNPSVGFFCKSLGLSFRIAKAAAVMLCFLVSAIAHEYIMWSASRRITWEWFTFFIIHGVLVVLEGYAWRSGLKDVPVSIRRAMGYAIGMTTGYMYMWQPMMRDNLDTKIMVPVLDAIGITPTMLGYDH